MFLIENLQESAEIRTEKILEIIRRRFRNENPVGFDAAPVRDRDRQPTFHTRQAGLQILFLAGERRFQYPFENLFMTELQSLLDGYVRIKGRKAGVIVPAAGEIPQGSHVSQPGK